MLCSQTEKDLLPKVPREKRSIVRREALTEHTASYREGIYMKKIRKIRRHIVGKEALKTKTSNFALDPCLHWKAVESSER